jgi:uncharacterized protein YjbI with pentapeptide repeats
MGDRVPLDEVVADWLETHSHGLLEIVGGPGSGKTTALEQVARELPPDSYTLLVDDADIDDVRSHRALRRVIYTCDKTVERLADLSLRLTSWSDDELIEYLLAVHPDQCRSVMARLRGATDRRALHGVPEMWRLVLDGMAHDETALDWRAVLRREIEQHLTDEHLLRRACDYAIMGAICGDASDAEPIADEMRETGCDARLLRLLRHRAVQLLLAADQLRAALIAGNEPALFTSPLPSDLVREVAASVANVPQALDTLRRIVESRNLRVQPAAASLLHAIGTGWRPRSGATKNLQTADLRAAEWPGIDLWRVGLGRADLSESDLRGAEFCEANLSHARLRAARLSDAVLADCNAVGADFSHADMSRVDARRMRLCGCDLTSANLTEANLVYAKMENANLSFACLHAAVLNYADLTNALVADADFSGAQLRGAMLFKVVLRGADITRASFKFAKLVECDLEQIELADADFERANLTRAYLTGSIMPRACFHGAQLRGAGLADIAWEGANLRQADLRECSFYLGSTRSGLVGSPIACEGSRTGFYTDDYDEQQFKSPEEIRKANLRGADLRGANVLGVDFYLVDLRGARYSPEQGQHFRRCGAILADRMEP